MFTNFCWRWIVPNQKQLDKYLFEYVKFELLCLFEFLGNMKTILLPSNFFIPHTMHEGVGSSEKFASESKLWTKSIELPVISPFDVSHNVKCWSPDYRNHKLITSRDNSGCIGSWSEVSVKLFEVGYRLLVKSGFNCYINVATIFIDI